MRARLSGPVLPVGLVERWLSMVSASAETASLAVTPTAGMGLVWDGELDSECCGPVDGDGVAAEVAGLVGPAAGGDCPGPAGHLAGDGSVR